MFSDVFLLFMIEFRAIISIMFQFLIIVTFDLFFKNILLMSTFDHIRIRSRRLCESLSDAIFFFWPFLWSFFSFSFWKWSRFLFLFLSYGNVLCCSKKFWIFFDSFSDLSFWLVVFFFNWFNLGGFIIQDTKINENCVVHQLNINLLI